MSRSVDVNKKLARDIIRLLLKDIPRPGTELGHSSRFELLAATILSAQATDAQVNKATPALFRRYRSIKAFADAPLEDLQEAVSSINFYRKKARNIRNSARMIIKEVGARVPGSMEELVRLPGVARKTANIILSDGFGVQEGIAVDTHVKRLSNRLGLTKHHDPVKIEQDLMAVTPRKQWSTLSHLLILHGRRVCKARSPLHDKCVLYKLCPSRDI